ncbi:MAG TPA: asparagine synthase (glutamine-hydrolyzing), partial [Tepidisphaeraceae bacterium]
TFLNHDAPAPGLPQVGLVFRRLAVLDPDPRAMQPMSTPDGRHTLVYNGEIYNYQTLRSELSPRSWRTTGDTEVLLHALADQGTSALQRLNGMFALALWDEQEKTLLLARDRMGQKPLYYLQRRNQLVAFASELPAITAVEPPGELDSQALRHYLRYGFIAAPRTIYADVRMLPPGHFLKVRFDEADATAVPETCPWPARRAGGSTRELVERAVERQMVSDVPLGVLLSGGIDSSIIAAAARRHGPVHSFSIGFDDPRYDESAYAARVAKHLGTIHHAFHVTPDAAADLPKLAAVFGEPFGDSSALPTHYLAQQTRQHVTVALSGDGGDELFGGYERYRAMSLPLKWLRPLAPIGRRFSRGHPKATLTRLGRLLQSAGQSPVGRYAGYLALFDEVAVNSLIGDSGSTDTLAEEWAARYTGDAVTTALAVDRGHYLPGDLLTKIDRASMLHALEVRSPFMDPDLVMHAQTLTRDQLLRGGKKRMLREAFAADLPAEVFTRAKRGFAVPIGDWLRGPLRSMLHDTLLASTSFTASHLNKPLIEEWMAEHDTGRVDHAQRLYALLMLDLWHQSVAQGMR